jgi:hypothetical protein
VSLSLADVGVCTWPVGSSSVRAGIRASIAIALLPFLVNQMKWS